MRKAIIILIVGWLIFRYLNRPKTPMVAPTIAPTGPIAQYLTASPSTGYSTVQIDYRFNQFVEFTTAANYEEAKLKATGDRPLLIRVSADENLDNAANSYYYWPNSTAEDRLELATI